MKRKENMNITEKIMTIGNHDIKLDAPYHPTKADKGSLPR